MFCKNCGNNVENDAFCSICGAPLEAETAFEAPADLAPATNPGKGLGIASLIVSIICLALGTVCSCLFACLGGFLPLLGAIAGLVLGIIGLNKSKAAGCKNTPALVGLILSIVTIVIILVFMCFNGILGGINGATQAANSSYYYSGY